MLKIENISKTFNPGTINEKAALQGLSLHLLPGDFVTIIGSNGAGKSTLFNAILREHGLHCRIFYCFIGRMEAFLHVKIIRIGKHKVAHTEMFQIQIHIKSVCKHNGQI